MPRTWHCDSRHALRVTALRTLLHSSFNRPRASGDHFVLLTDVLLFLTFIVIVSLSLIELVGCCWVGAVTLV